MVLEVKPYDLPDAGMFKGSGDGLLIWQPGSTVIVMGQSNTPEGSLITETVMADGITVTKRPTGGEAVVLTPHMAVITLAREYSTIIPSKEFFGEINGLIISILYDLGVRDLESKGISDITIGHRKILGSSMYRRENRLVYHAVLNIAGDPVIIERYLQHPRREPGYRQNRRHSEFVTSLRNEGYKTSFEDVSSLVNASINLMLPLKESTRVF
jgi:lipoate-protein ligase A